MYVYVTECYANASSGMPRCRSSSNYIRVLCLYFAGALCIPCIEFDDSFSLNRVKDGGHELHITLYIERLT